MRLTLHYIGTAVIIGFYGNQVCPFLESLSLSQLLTPLVICLVVLWFARRPIRARLIDKADYIVEENNEYAIKHDDAHHQRVVTIQRALHKVAAEPRHPEYLFDDHRAGDHGSGGRSQIRDHRQQPAS